MTETPADKETVKNGLSFKGKAVNVKWKAGYQLGAESKVNKVKETESVKQYGVNYFI